MRWLLVSKGEGGCLLLSGLLFDQIMCPCLPPLHVLFTFVILILFKPMNAVWARISSPSFSSCPPRPPLPPPPPSSSSSSSSSLPYFRPSFLLFFLILHPLPSSSFDLLLLLFHSYVYFYALGRCRGPCADSTSPAPPPPPPCCRCCCCCWYIAWGGGGGDC